jgi:hypothetical protein
MCRGGTTVPIESQPGRHPDLSPLCDLSRLQGCIAHRSPSDIGEGNCHPHSGEELRVLAPQGLKRASVGRRSTRATVTGGGPWQLRSPPQSPGGLVQHHTRIASLAPFAPHTPSRARVVAKCPNCHQPARERATARCRTSQSLLWMQHSGSSPKILRPNQPGPGRTEPSSQLASRTPEREMDHAG